jgi:hypothetical protein
MGQRIAHAQDHLAQAVEMTGKCEQIPFNRPYRQVARLLTQRLQQLATGIDCKHGEPAVSEWNRVHTEAGTQVDCLARQAGRQPKCFDLFGAAGDCRIDAAGHPGVHRTEMRCVVLSDRRHGCTV